MGTTVEINCPTCDKKLFLSPEAHRARIRSKSKTCRDCVGKLLSSQMKERYQDLSYKKHMTQHLHTKENEGKRILAIETVRGKIAESIRRLASTPEGRASRVKQVKTYWRSLSDKDKKERRKAAIMTLQKISLEVKERAIENSKITHQSELYKDKQRKQTEQLFSDGRIRKKISQAVKNAYADPIKSARLRLRKPYTEEMRRASSDRMKKLWMESKEYKNNWLIGMTQRSENHNWISAPQKILYNILDDLQVSYYREPDHIKELSFGCYRCDAIIKAERPIIVFVHGDYFHRFREEVVKKDKRFIEFYNNKLYDRYDLLVLWEHEFLARNRIRDIIIKKLGIQIKPIEIQKDNIIIKIVNYDEAEKFLKAYHYMAKIGRAGLNIGAYYQNKLIAIAVYCNVTRKETADRLKLEPYQVLELSRFCIHPGIQSHNLASWFLARSINILKKERSLIKMLVSFADLGFDHKGTIYKASGWKEDGVIEPTYWYMDEDGHILHKKTLYNHARSIRMQESAFAIKFNYKKIKTGKRIRFVKEL